MYPQGHKTHVAVFADLLQLLMVLPGRAAGDFRLKAANFLCRLLSGDVTLIPQILQTAANTSREAQAVIMQAVPVPPVDESMVLKRCREENALLDIEERKQRLQIKTSNNFRISKSWLNFTYRLFGFMVVQSKKKNASQ